MNTKFYKDLNINEKINAKSWGCWRLPNPNGYFMTMIDNANSFNRKDYANFSLTQLCDEHKTNTPKVDGVVNIYCGISRPYERLVPLCREIAHSFNSTIVVDKHTSKTTIPVKLKTIVFKTRDTDKEYVWLYFDLKTRSVYSCYYDKDEVLIESVDQLKELVKKEFSKISK